jgi:ABC-type lipoprotein release transport system permease subunit
MIHRWAWLGIPLQFSYLGIGPDFFDTFPDAFDLSDITSDLTNVTCYLERSYAIELGIALGSEFNATLIAFNPWRFANVSYTVVGFFESTFYWTDTNGADEHSPRLKMITTRSSLETRFHEAGFGSSNSLIHSFWLKLDDAVTSQSSIEDAENELRNIRSSIEQRTVPFAIVSEYRALSAVYQYTTWYTNIISIAIAFSIPCIVMGFMIVQYNQDLLADKWRQDVGNLKTRGASNRQTLSWLLTLSFPMGVVGGCGAIVAGILTALLSEGLTELLTLDISRLGSLAILIQPQTIFLVFLFSFAVSFIVSLPAAVRSLLYSIADSQKKLDASSNLDEELASPLYEISIIAISGILSVPFLSILGYSLTQGPGGLYLLVLVILMLGMFIVSLVRFLSRPASSFKNRLMRSKRFSSSGVLSHVFSKSVLSRRKSEATGAMFISMVFLACFFSAISSHTSSTNLRNNILYTHGADLNIHLVLETSISYESVLEEIESLQGVSSACVLSVTTAFVQYLFSGPVESTFHNRSIQIIGVQPRLWYETAYWESYFAKGLGTSMALDMIQQNTSLVLTSFRPVIGYHLVDSAYTELYSDELSLLLESGELVDLEIVDILSEDQTLESPNYLPGFPDVEEFIVVNMDLLEEHSDSFRVTDIEIDIQEGYDWQVIMQQIHSIIPDAIEYYDSAIQEIDHVVSSRSTQSIYGIYNLNILFTLLYLTIGTGVMTVSQSRKKQKEYAILRSLGVENSAILSSTLLETAMGIAFSLIIGGGVGILMSFMIHRTSLIYSNLQGQTAIGLLPISYAIPWSILVSICLLGFIFPLVVTLLISRGTLKRNIAADLMSAE